MLKGDRNSIPGFSEKRLLRWNVELDGGFFAEIHETGSCEKRRACERSSLQTESSNHPSRRKKPISSSRRTAERYTASRLGIQPDFVIGDFDSLDAETLAALKAKGAELIEFPAKKDFTDLELAIQHAGSLKPRDILIYGALGARWDQTIANILLAGAYPHLNIHLVDQKQEIRYLVPGERLVVTRSFRRYCLTHPYRRFCGGDHHPEPGIPVDRRDPPFWEHSRDQQYPAGGLGCGRAGRRHAAVHCHPLIEQRRSGCV